MKSRQAVHDRLVARDRQQQTPKPATAKKD